MNDIAGQDADALVLWFIVTCDGVGDSANTWKGDGVAALKGVKAFAGAVAISGIDVKGEGSADNVGHIVWVVVAAGGAIDARDVSGGGRADGAGVDKGSDGDVDSNDDGDDSGGESGGDEGVIEAVAAVAAGVGVFASDGGTCIGDDADGIAGATIADVVGIVRVEGAGGVNGIGGVVEVAAAAAVVVGIEGVVDIDEAGVVIEVAVAGGRGIAVGGVGVGVAFIETHGRRGLIDVRGTGSSVVKAMGVCKVLKGEWVLRCINASWVGIKNGRKVNGRRQCGVVLHEVDGGNGADVRGLEDGLVAIAIEAGVSVSSAGHVAGGGGAGTVAVVLH